MMRISIERLRAWLLVGAGLLVLVIAGFLEYAHVRAHRFLRDLPSRLGINIARESNNFTYSQSGKGGRTIYTIRAAKLVQYVDGKTTLHDVGIVLYGQKQDRADRIYGKEFEYDQKEGVIRALGEVHLDLQAPAPADAQGRAEYAAGRDVGGSDERGVVHVTTSGLVFMQKLGVASTDQEIEFEYRGMNGRAKGADYNSDTGLTVLQTEVRVSGIREGRPVVLTAGHAEMDRGKEQLSLTNARYVTVGDGAKTLTAAEARLHLREDGSVERVEGGGGVSLEQDGGVLRGQRAEVTVNPESRPETAHVMGEVTYAEETSLRQMQAKAGDGTARFDGKGRIGSAALTGQAEMQERVRANEGGEWSERTVSGETIEMSFATGEGGRQRMRAATAKGAARTLLVDRAKAPETTTELRGDTLMADLLWDGRAARLNHLSGSGHTSLRRSDTTGAEDTAEGPALQMNFVSAGDAAQAAGRGAVARGGTNAVVGGGATAVSDATLSGGVVLTRVAGKVPGKPQRDPVHATGSEARFERDGEMLTLNGGVQVTEGDSLLRATTVTMRQGTGEGTAAGSVEASYRQPGSAEPVHVLAERAQFRQEAGGATFFGAAGGMARLWQGGSQVESPVIELDQRAGTLVASTPAGGPAIRTVLVSGGQAGDAGAGKRVQVMRILSRTLRYTDGDRRAQFGGGVRVQDADGTMRAAQVVAQLKGNAADGAKAGFLGGSVDRVTADGGVEVTEAGRRANGERLVYTSADGMSVMTGTAAVPPKVVDEVQGTITGSALEFHAGDNSVMVLGGGGKGGDGRRVHTETQVRPR